jgi:hypothetical protein
MVAEGATRTRQKFPSIYSRTKIVPGRPNSVRLVAFTAACTNASSSNVATGSPKMLTYLV